MPSSLSLRAPFVRLARLLKAAAPALLLAGASCATVPDLDHYLLHREAPRIEGAKGTLSAAQTKQILDDLKKRSPDAGVLGRHIAIEEALSGHPLTAGNKATVLADGQQTYAQMLAAIRGARSSVNMEMYIFEDDEIGQLFAHALEERARAGVQVRLLYDSAGSHKTDKSFFKAMQDQGVHVAEYNPLTAEQFLKKGFELQRRDHRKVLVVDGKLAFLGGINVSGVYGNVYTASHSKRTSDSAVPGAGGSASAGKTGSHDERKDVSPGSSSGSGSSKPVNHYGEGVKFEDRPWRDLQVKLEGPVVADVQQAFIHQWAKTTKETLSGAAFLPQLSPAGHEVVRIMESAAGEEPNRLYVALVSAIENAETEVIVMNAYFVPHPDLLDALRAAARRGVDVKLILPSKSDSAVLLYAAHAYYEDLLEAGVKVYERQSRFLHAKSAMVDGVWCTIGSTNLDWRSLVYNDELNAVVLSPDFGNQLRAIFDQDFQNSRQITPDEWAHRPLADRIKEAGARLWAQLL